MRKLPIWFQPNSTFNYKNKKKSGGKKFISDPLIQKAGQHIANQIRQFFGDEWGNFNTCAVENSNGIIIKPTPRTSTKRLVSSLVSLQWGKHNRDFLPANGAECEICSQIPSYIKSRWGEKKKKKKRSGDSPRCDGWNESDVSESRWPPAAAGTKTKIQASALHPGALHDNVLLGSQRSPDHHHHHVSRTTLQSARLPDEGVIFKVGNTIPWHFVVGRQRAVESMQFGDVMS